jgi:hypothetical protein
MKSLARAALGSLVLTGTAWAQTAGSVEESRGNGPRSGALPQVRRVARWADWVKSELGAGSSFTFTIPVQRPRP